MVIASFLLFLCCFLGVGLYSMRFSRKTAEDYLIAGKAVPAWLVGLSAIATNNSGYMFIGMIGYTFTDGLNTIWLMIGWIIGDLVANLLSVRSLRRAANKERIHSFGGLLAHWYGGDQRLLRRIAGLATVFFLTIYAAAQLKAGSKAAEVLLDWNLATGIIAGAVIVLAYSFAGGIRASIWTDAAQSFVMIIGMALLMIGGIHHMGGLDATFSKLGDLSNLVTNDDGNLVAGDHSYMAWFPALDWFGVVLFIIGWVFGGAAVIGQPHVVIRFMSLDDPSRINRMRLWYYTWFTLFYGATIVVGLLARLIIDNAAFDPETALPLMATELLPGVLVGLILAALFAATMSTADSLVLSCSAAVTRDFILRDRHTAIGAKLATAAVLFIATVIALSGNETVFRMVLDAWGMLGSAFVPLIVALALGYRCPQPVAVVAVLAGIGTFVAWKLTGGIGPYVYEVAPGMTAGAIVLLIGRLAFGQDRNLLAIERGEAEGVAAPELAKPTGGKSDDGAANSPER